MSKEKLHIQTKHSETHTYRQLRAPFIIYMYYSFVICPYLILTDWSLYLQTWIGPPHTCPLSRKTAVSASNSFAKRSIAKGLVASVHIEGKKVNEEESNTGDEEK